MLALTNKHGLIIPVALAMMAMAVPLSGAAAQQREILLLLAPEPEDTNDLQYTLELGREARIRIENRLRHRLSIVETDDICKLLRDSGFGCDQSVDATGAARMAQAMGVDVYMVGKFWFVNSTPQARFRMVDIGRSGLSGWVTIRGTAGDPPRSFAQIIVDSLLTQMRAAELTRECNARRDSGDFERALREAQKVFEMYPNHPSAATCAAVVREAMGQPPDSQIPEYERAIRGDSLLDRAYQRLGQRYLAIGDSLNALGAFRKQMYLTPDDRTRWYGVINQYIAIGEYSEAESLVNQWLERQPNDLEFLTLKTLACFRGKLWGCAVASLEKQYELNDEFREDAQFYKDIMAAAMAADLPDAVMRWSGVAVENLPDDFHLGRSLERRASRDELVKDRAEGVDVACRADLVALACRLLGWHVTGCAQNLSRGCEVALTLDPFGQTEIGDAWQTIFVQQDVIGFQVPMDDALLMRICHSLSDTSHKRRRFTWRQWTIDHFVCKASTLHQAHRKVMLTFLFTNFVDRYNPWVVELCCGFSLTVESANCLL